MVVPDFTVANEVALIVYGMFLWDYSITLWFEFYFITGKLKLRWPLIPYFLTRYSAFGFVIGCLIFQTRTRPLDCDGLYLGGVVLGKVAVASASVNILVRTVIIWSYRWYIVLLMVLLVTGEVTLIWLGFGKRDLFAMWSDDLQRCIVNPGSQSKNLGLFAPYALCVDCIILSLTIFGLRKFDSTSGFASVLIRQGVGFFLLVLLFQTFVTVSVYSSGNVILAPASAGLCAVIVPAVSCYMVRSILSSSYSASGPATVSSGSPTTDGGYCRRDGVQLTTHVELGSSSSE